MEDDFRSEAMLCAKVTCLEKSLPLGLCYRLPASLSISFCFYIFFLPLKGTAEIFSTSVSLFQGGGHAQQARPSPWCRWGHTDLTEQESLELGQGLLVALVSLPKAHAGAVTRHLTDRD